MAHSPSAGGSRRSATPSRSPCFSNSPCAASSVAPPADGRLPRSGDTWTYRLSEPRRSDGPTQSTYTVRVSAASREAILDQYTINGGPSGEWAHSAGPAVVALGRSLFAPYLSVLGDLTAQRSLGRVRIDDPACTGAYVCEATARVAGRPS